MRSTEKIISTNSYISKSLVTIVDFHKISHHHGFGLQNSPLFCTWYNFSYLFGFGRCNCYGGKGIRVSTIETSMGEWVGSMGIWVSSMGIWISSIGMGVGVSSMQVGGNNRCSDGYGGNSWGSNLKNSLKIIKLKHNHNHLKQRHENKDSFGIIKYLHVKLIKLCS